MLIIVGYAGDVEVEVEGGGGGGGGGRRFSPPPLFFFTRNNCLDPVSVCHCPNYVCPHEERTTERKQTNWVVVGGGGGEGGGGGQGVKTITETERQTDWQAEQTERQAET